VLPFNASQWALQKFSPLGTVQLQAGFSHFSSLSDMYKSPWGLDRPHWIGCGYSAIRQVRSGCIYVERNRFQIGAFKKRKRCDGKLHPAQRFSFLDDKGLLFGVVRHAMPIDHDHILVAFNPGIVARRNRNNITGPGRRFSSVVHAGNQDPG